VRRKGLLAAGRKEGVKKGMADGAGDMNICEKLISAHLLKGRLRAGEDISIRIDQTLTQDATGTLAYLQFEALGAPSVRTELSVSYVDHNTLQQGYENADDHRYLETVASKYGILFSKAGNGICHQVHLERFARPGRTLLGSDSHTPTAGGIGSLAIGAGGLDVALAMAGAPFSLEMPKVIGIELSGRPKPHATAKDVILHLLGALTTKGNVGFAIEYFGDGLKGLSVPMRATIANMGAELGVTASVFPSDEITRDFLKRQGREKEWVELKADDGARYDKVMKIGLGALEPLAAKPHSPDNVEAVAKLEGKRVDQVCVGSCTNSSYEDLMVVAGMLKGRHVHPGIELVVAPGSRQVLEMLSGNGALAELVRSGARIAESACGFCIGAGHSPGSGGVSLRTSNRNFKGRSGTEDAEVYLVSPVVAAASALAGVIKNPERLDIPKIALPEKYFVDDSMVLKPGFDGQVVKGPNIKDLPRFPGMKGSLRGVAAIKVGDKITTDDIIPAGARMKFRSNIQKYSGFVFELIEPGFAEMALANKANGLDNFIIAGASYGQGSSREHAALCPAYLGVKAVIARSIERIHRANLVNFGIIPLQFADEKDYGSITQGDELEAPGIRAALSGRSEIWLLNKTRKTKMLLDCSLADDGIRVLLKGGKLNYSAGG